MRNAIQTAYENYPDIVSTAQACLESFIRSERVLLINRYPREHYAQEQHCLVAIDYSDRIAKKRFNFLDAREDLGNLATLYEEFATRDSRAAATSLRLFRTLLQTTSELAALIENHTRVQRTNWQAVLDSYSFQSYTPPQGQADNFLRLLPRLSQITEIKLLGESRSRFTGWEGVHLENYQHVRNRTSEWEALSTQVLADSVLSTT